MRDDVQSKECLPSKAEPGLRKGDPSQGPQTLGPVLFPQVMEIANTLLTACQALSSEPQVPVSTAL